MEPRDTKHGKVAFEFATSIANGDFSTAHDFLTEKQKIEWKPEALKEEYNEMIEYGESPIIHIEVMNEMTEWPAKQTNDIGWAYVAMNGEGYGEAIVVVVCNENNQPKIREIEWGRP
jgi:hypothetical protein